MSIRYTRLDLIGKRFGNLTVKKFSHIDEWRNAVWECLCDCSNTRLVRSGSLTEGKAIRCKDCSLNHLVKINTTHGLSYSKIYSVWQGMINRCLNPKHDNYHIYGGRGIKICERWMKFENFYEDMGDPPNGLTIHRVNNNGNYCKENCIWATKKIQDRNRSDNNLITYKNETKCLIEWSEILGIKPETIRARLNYGWTLEETFNKKVGNYGDLIKFNNEERSISEWAEILGIKYSTLYNRLRKGWSIQKALTKK